MLSRRDPERGFLFGYGGESDILVEFQFNPTQISDQRKINYATLSAPGMLLPIRQYTEGGDRTLSFTVRVDGTFEDPTDHTGIGGHGISIERDDDGGITTELNKYRAFVYPRIGSWQEAHESFIPLFENVKEFTSPPEALFGFGAGRIIQCIVTEVNVTELSFNERLAPLRADVAVTIVEVNPYFKNGG